MISEMISMFALICFTLIAGCFLVHVQDLRKQIERQADFLAQLVKINQETLDLMRKPVDISKDFMPPGPYELNEKGEMVALTKRR